MNTLNLVINLKKDVRKREKMEMHLSDIGIDFKFLDAIYGLDLKEEELSEFSDVETSRRLIGREINVGEIGCYLSHINAAKMLLESDFDFALVLEDDVCISKKILNVAKNGLIQTAFEHGAEICFLGHHSTISRSKEPLAKIKVKYKSDLFKVKHNIEAVHGAYGYILSRAAAKKLVDEYSIAQLPIDHVLGDPEKFNTVFVSPALISIDEELGSLSNLDFFREKHSDDISFSKLLIRKSRSAFLLFIRYMKLYYLHKNKFF